MKRINVNPGEPLDYLKLGEALVPHRRAGGEGGGMKTEIEHRTPSVETLSQRSFFVPSYQRGYYRRVVGLRLAASILHTYAPDKFSQAKPGFKIEFGENEKPKNLI